MVRRSPTRAGFTLLEVVIVSSFVAIFALFLAGTIVTSTTMNRDTFIENEVVDLANRAADDMAAELSGAGRFTDCWDISSVATIGGVPTVMGDVLEFQDVRYNALNKIFGARTVRGGFADGGVRRLVFVPERTYNETTARVDIDGDGYQTNTAAVVGRIELRVYAGSPPPPAAQVNLTTTELVGLRRTFGGGTVRFSQRPGAPTGVPTAGGDPIFGRTPYTAMVGATFYQFWPRHGQIVRTEDDVNTVPYGSANHDPCDLNGPTVPGGSGEEYPEALRTTPLTTFYPAPAAGDGNATSTTLVGNLVPTGFLAATKVQTTTGTVPSTGAPVNALNEFTEGAGASITQADTSVRINLRVIYNPTPDARGQAEIHTINVARVVSLQ